MRMEAISLLEWQNRFGSEKACAEALKKVRWPTGFSCPECAGKEYRQLYNSSFGLVGFEIEKLFNHLK